MLKRGMTALAVACIVILAHGAAFAADPTDIYSDDFESYALGAHPPQWDELNSNDTETVSDLYAASPTQSLQSLTTDGSTIQRPYLDLGALSLLPLPDGFAYEAVIHMEATPEEFKKEIGRGDPPG